MTITHGEHFTSFTGPDIERYQAAAIRASIKLAMKGIRINRMTTNTVLLKAASRLTGKTYKRTDLQTAYIDLADHL